jgi:hypothetical protein
MDHLPLIDLRLPVMRSRKASAKRAGPTVSSTSSATALTNRSACASKT